MKSTNKSGSKKKGTGRTVHGLDPYKLKEDFPILQTTIRGKPLTFLDSAASSQKPRVVIDAIKFLYEKSYANIHRGVYRLSAQATKTYEMSRIKVQQFINAGDYREIVFVRGTTEAINLIASSFGRSQMQEGDEVIISAMEHHANIVPWQLLRDDRGIKLKVIPINLRGELILDEYERLFGPGTKLVSVCHVSNALGTINPVKEIIEMAHSRGIPVLLDGAQAVPHMPVDVQELDCDFYAFSSHKMYGPTGIGVLYGKYDMLEKLPPYQGGGDMIESVTFEKTTFAKPPGRFEAGTPDIAGAAGLGVAIAYLTSIGMEAIHQYDCELRDYGIRLLQQIEGLTLIGTAEQKIGILSFVLEGVHPHDIGTVLDSEGIAVRTGHHCAQPVMDFYNVTATTRASLSYYNTKEDLDRLAGELTKIIKVFR